MKTSEHPDELLEELASAAVCKTDHPAAAASSLIAAASIILERTFGTEIAIHLMRASLDMAADQWRSRHAN